MSSITDTPDIDEMFTALKQRAILRGKIKIKELEIKEVELPIREQFPRNTAKRDRVSLDLQRELIMLQGELESVDSTIEYWTWFKDIWKSNQYALNRQLT